MKYIIWKYVLTIIIKLCALSNIGVAQTLFRLPDTVPKYVEYQYIDQCVSAVRRTIYHHNIKDTIWYDTASDDVVAKSSFIPKDAIKLGNICLSRKNIDSIPITDFESILPFLLIINRDEDVNRIVQKALDTISHSNRDSIIYSIIRLYQRATPKRLNLLKNILARSDSPYKNVAMKGGKVLSEALVARMALDANQPEIAVAFVKEIMNKDGIYRIPLSNLSTSEKIQHLYPLMYEVSINHLMDSLAVSTIAYLKSLERMWSTISNSPLTESYKSLSYINGIIPQIKGEFWYSNVSEDRSIDDSIRMEKTRRVSEMIIPYRGAVNLIVFLQGGCHIKSQGVRHGRTNGGAGCAKKIAMIKRLKEKFPGIRITVVSKTFGSIANSPPLKPNDEADTLAEYFLGFYKIPGVQVVAETKFIRIPGLDRRRLDLEVDYEAELNSSNLSWHGQLLLVDQNGHVFYSSYHTVFNKPEILLEKMITAVERRPVNLTSLKKVYRRYESAQLLHPNY